MDPSRIIQTGMGFFSSKVLLSAVELDVFTKLGDQGAMTGEELGKLCGLHPRAIYDFFDALVALGFLLRDGDGPDARYRNTPETALFLDRNKRDTYVGGSLEMANARLYRFWADLTEALRTGQPQNEVKHSKKPVFEELFADAGRLEQFMNAMTGLSRGNFMAFAEKFDFSKYQTLCDVGGATALLCRIVAARHPHLKLKSFDLPPVAPIAQKHVDREGLSDRIEIVSGDFFKDELPRADIITMGMVLHDWNLEKKMHLIRSAYRALPEGGAFVVIEVLIDDARRTNAYGLLASLNMLIEFGDAFDYTGADFRRWCSEVGFKRFDQFPLAGAASAAIAYK